MLETGGRDMESVAVRRCSTGVVLIAHTGNLRLT